MYQLKFAASAAVLLFCFASNSGGNEAQAEVPLQKASIKVVRESGDLSVKAESEYARQITGEEWKAVEVLAKTWGGFADSTAYVAVTARSASVIIPVPQERQQAAKGLPTVVVKRTRSRGHLDRFEIHFSSRPTKAERQRIAEAVKQLCAAERGIKVTSLTAEATLQRRHKAVVVNVDPIRHHRR